MTIPDNDEYVCVEKTIHLDDGSVETKKVARGHATEWDLYVEQMLESFDAIIGLHVSTDYINAQISIQKENIKTNGTFIIYLMNNTYIYHRLLKVSESEYKRVLYGIDN